MLLSVALALVTTVIGGALLIGAGRSVLGRLIIVGAVGAAILTRAFLLGGVESTPYTGWVVVVLLAAAMFDARGAGVAAVIGSAAGLLLMALDSSGYMPLPLRPDSPLLSWEISSALFLVVALLAGALVRRIEQALFRFATADAGRREHIARYELAGQSAQFGVWDLDREHDQIWLDPGVMHLLGESELAHTEDGAHFHARIHPEDQGAHEAALDHHLAGNSAEYRVTYRIRHSDGRWLWTQSRARVVPETGGQRIIGSLVDVERTRTMEQELKHLAFHDPLTGLPNRNLFLDRVGQSLSKARRAGASHFAVVFLDLDRFKLVNDSLGHAAGDALLVEIADRLKATVRSPDTVARLGGDEFTLLLEDVADVEMARVACRRVLAALEAPFLLHDNALAVGVSAGILMGSVDYEDPVDLVRDADLAMYSVKGRPNVPIGVFEARMGRQARDLMALDQALKAGLDRGEFVPWYQPIVDLRSGTMVGAEALARWAHPDGTVGAPSSFITRAEETGLIRDLDRTIIAAAIRDLGPTDLVVSVNLSAQQFGAPGLADWLIATMRASGLPPERLQVEVTETILLADLAGARQTLGRLRAEGIRIALDDFGTGYSSLSYLHQLDLEVLKIDISFVQEMGAAGPGPICEAIASMAQKLGLRTSAEGIETPAQQTALVAFGCRVGQGYLLGRPMPLKMLLAAEREVAQTAGI